VNCGIIVFCDKRSLLTSNGLLLQRAMQKDIKKIREDLHKELHTERVKQKEELLALKVSSPTRCSHIHNLFPPHMNKPNTDGTTAFEQCFLERLVSM